MGLTYTKEELEAAGYYEVKPGVFARRITKPVLAEGPKRSKSQYSHVKQQTKCVGGKTHKFRSKWEYDYARYLEFLKKTKQIKDWEYEPKRFDFPIKRGSNSYLPDFKIHELCGKHHWIEVKGYLDQKGSTKLNRMAKYFPDEVVKLVRKEEIKELRKSGILEMKL